MSGTVGFSPISFIENFGRRAMNYLVGNDEPVGLAGCGLVGEQWASPDAGADAGTDGDVDGGTNCDNYPGDFSLDSPTDGAANVALSPNLQWQVSVDPDTGDLVTYRVLVDDDSTFGSPLQYNDISGNQLTIPDTLLNEQTYYWQVFASDLCEQETPSPVFSFTTIEACATPPGAFSLADPAHELTGVSVTPVFDWTDSIDPDAGDSVTYTLQIDTVDTFPAPTVFTAIADSAYTLGAADALNSNTTYYWRVVAEDGCNNEVNSTETFSFTTGEVCLPQTYNDALFLGGTASDTEVAAGIVRLIRDNSAWTCYDGTVFPETVGWTENAPLAWTTKAIVGGELHLSSIDLNTNARYEIDPSFVGSGWMVETRMRLVDSQGGTGCAIDVRDGANSVILRIQNAQINEDNTGEFFLMDPTAGYNIYRIVNAGGSFSVYVNDILRLNGAAAASGSPSHLWFHDIGGTFDSEAYWDYLCYYNGGSSLPFVPSGTYTSEIIDTLNSSNNIGSGALFHWSQNTPAGTSITMQFCASNDSGLAGATCANGLVNNAGEIIPGGVTGRYFQWEATLAPAFPPPETPELFDVTLNYETCE